MALDDQSQGRAPKCANPLCAAQATHFPVISFGPTHASEPLPYRLEVPRGMCGSCQEGFDPRFFFGDKAREGVVAMLDREERMLPDFTRLKLEWVSIDDPSFAEIAGGGCARLWF